MCSSDLFPSHDRGRDLDGEAFTPETDIWLKVGDKVNLTYYHGFDPDTIGKKQKIPALIGRATYIGADERGHWFEPVLDSEEPLAQRLMKADITELRASSGAINHLLSNSQHSSLCSFNIFNFNFCKHFTLFIKSIFNPLRHCACNLFIIF